MVRSAQNAKKGNSKDEKKKEEKNKKIEKAHKELIDFANQIILKSEFTLSKVESKDHKTIKLKNNIEHFILYGKTFVDQINRRVINGETIPHEEKIFSIFEPHTEWISKGKAGVPQELGVRVCVAEDQYQFIVNHKVMENKTDVDVAVDIIKDCKLKFPNLIQSSFDKGFHSKENQELLNEVLQYTVMPTKGKPSKKTMEKEQEERFLAARRKHSGIESAINGLEVHGLDVCPDRGIDAFKRYVGLAVVARNIQQIGTILQRKEKVDRLKQLEKKPFKNSLQKIAA